MLHPVDIHVGGKLKEMRNLRGLTQEDISEKLGITFQQMQKYEKGMNRIGASRLYELSIILGVCITDFFKGFPHTPAPASLPADIKTAAVVRLWNALDSPQKKVVLSLMRVLTI